MNTVPLLDSTIKRVQAGWAAKLMVETSTLLAPGITLISVEDSKTMFALELQGSTVVRCPRSLLPSLSLLSQNELLDMDLLLQILHEHQPKPFGIATIAYADVSTLEKSSNLNLAKVANTDDLDVVLSSCTQDEQDESGLAGMPFLFSAHAMDGSAGAVAGYETWNADIAHLGVLATPAQRGRGLAFSAAHRAARVVLEAELIPQWRCRVGNENSYRLGQRLGFHELGRQLAIDF